MSTNRVSQDKNAYFAFLPEDIHGNISYYLNDKDIVMLSKTSCTLFNTYESIRKDRILGNLYLSMVDHNLIFLRKIKEISPKILSEFLLNEAPKRWIECQTTWQRFFVEKPLKMAIKRRQLKILAELILYFKELEEIKMIPNGKIEILSQWNQALSEMNAQKNKEYDFKPLIDVIKKENFPNGKNGDKLIDRITETTKIELEENFKKILLPDEPILLKDYFDIEALLSETYQVLMDNLNEFKNPDQIALFVICVLGFVQSLLSPEVVEIFCYIGLREFVMFNNRVNTETDEMFKKFNIPFYRSSRSSQIGLGYDHVCYVISCREKRNQMLNYYNIYNSYNRHNPVLWLGGHSLSPPTKDENAAVYTKKLYQMKTKELNRIKNELEADRWPEFSFYCSQSKKNCTIL